MAEAAITPACDHDLFDRQDLPLMDASAWQTPARPDAAPPARPMFARGGGAAYVMERPADPRPPATPGTPNMMRTAAGQPGAAKPSIAPIAERGAPTELLFQFCGDVPWNVHVDPDFDVHGLTGLARMYPHGSENIVVLTAVLADSTSLRAIAGCGHLVTNKALCAQALALVRKRVYTAARMRVNMHRGNFPGTFECPGMVVVSTDVAFALVELALLALDREDKSVDAVRTVLDQDRGLDQLLEAGDWDPVKITTFLRMVPSINGH